MLNNCMLNLKTLNNRIYETICKGYFVDAYKLECCWKFRYIQHGGTEPTHTKNVKVRKEAGVSARTHPDKDGGISYVNRRKWDTFFDEASSITAAVMFKLLKCYGKAISSHVDHTQSCFFLRGWGGGGGGAIT